MLTKADGMGFTVTQTTIEAGMEIEVRYENHLEACFCIEGEIEDLETGARHVVGPGAIYALDRHDRHFVRATAPTRLVCVFAPAFAGDETHDASGGYAPAN
jgi:L-ectoine synthase